MNNKDQSEPESDREIVTTGLLDAERVLVFHAFSNPVHLANLARTKRI